MSEVPGSLCTRKLCARSRSFSLHRAYLARLVERVSVNAEIAPSVGGSKRRRRKLRDSSGSGAFLPVAAGGSSFCDPLAKTPFSTSTSPLLSSRRRSAARATSPQTSLSSVSSPARMRVKVHSSISRSSALAKKMALAELDTQTASGAGLGLGGESKASNNDQNGFEARSLGSIPNA